MFFIKKKPHYFITIISTFCLIGCQSEDRYQGYIEQHPVQIATSYRGKLLMLNVDRGSEVKKGDILFNLDPNPEADQLANSQALLQQAEAELDNARKGSRSTILQGLEAELAKAQASLSISIKKAHRFQKLFEKHAIDAETNDEMQAQVNVDRALVDDAVANLKEAELGERTDLIIAQEAKVAALAAQVNQAQWALAQKTVASPIDGHVLEVYYRPGELVDAGRPVISLLNPKQLHTIFFVPENKLGELCLGESIHITHDARDDRTPAKITFISPMAEYTPPVIYNRESDSMLVFKIQATLSESKAKSFYYGQPIDVYVPRASKCDE